MKKNCHVVSKPLGFERDVVIDFLETEILFELKTPTKMFVLNKTQLINGVVRNDFKNFFGLMFFLENKEDRTRFEEIEKSLLLPYSSLMKNYPKNNLPMVDENHHLMAYNTVFFCDKELQKKEKEILDDEPQDDSEAQKRITVLHQKDDEEKRHKTEMWNHMQYRIQKMKPDKVFWVSIPQDEIEYNELSELVIPTFRIYGVVLQSFTHCIHLAIALDSFKVVLSPKKKKMSSFLHPFLFDDPQDHFFHLAARMENHI